MKNGYNKNNIFDKFSSAFFKVKYDSIDLGKFNFSPWEWSSSEWDAFVNSYEGLKIGVNKMVEGINLNDKEVLDLGAGTGYVASYLLTKYPDAKFTLIDSAANMLSFAETILNNKVSYELSSFPSKVQFFVNNNLGKFDYIICHLSFQSIICKYEDLDLFVSQCKAILKNNGAILFAIHNSSNFNIKKKQAKEWVDLFKSDIEKEIVKRNLILRNERGFTFNEQDIIDKFKKNFNYKIDRINVEFEMKDRKKLWEIPAVLDSLVDIRSTGELRKSIISNAFSTNYNFRTLNRTLTFFRFFKK